MKRARRWVEGLLIVAVVGGGASAQSSPSNPAEELIRLERARQNLEQVLDHLFRSGSSDSRAARGEAMVDAAHDLVALGPDVVPALIDELEQGKPSNFYFVAHVLGLLGTPDARQALRRSIAAADEQNGDAAKFRKRWSAYGLGLAGEPEAIKLVNTGRHYAGHYSVQADVSVISAIALQNVPECVPILLAELERLKGGEAERRQRAAVVRALGQVGDPRAVPGLAGLMTEDPPDPQLRFKAVRSLGRIDTPEAVAALLAALEDPEPHIRSAAAVSLERLLPAAAMPTLLRRIEEETDPGVRGRLYRTVAELGGASTLETLAPFKERPNPVERQRLIVAVARLRDPRALPILGAALNDPYNDIAMEAIRGLAAIGTEEATALLIGQIDSPAWPRASIAITFLVENDRIEAAPAIAGRLLEVELDSVVRTPGHRSRVDQLVRAVVALRHPAALEGLRNAADRQPDATLLGTISNAIAELELLETNGSDVELWIKTLDASRAEDRKLAYRELGRSGSAAAAAALVSRFGRVDLDEGVAVVTALGRVDHPGSRELIRRVLVAPEFDGVERLDLREAAAWSARRLGGGEMLAALQESARRRVGRDVRVLVYAAVLGREAALPLLDELRLARMRHLSGVRGTELDALDRIALRIRRGRSLHDYDLPPQLLDFR